MRRQTSLNDLDPKARRMLEIFEYRRFTSTRANRKLRFKLLVWSLRTKLLNQLKRVLDVSVASVALVAVARALMRCVWSGEKRRNDSTENSKWVRPESRWSCESSAVGSSSSSATSESQAADSSGSSRGTCRDMAEVYGNSCSDK